jgi:hypothetical protein
MLGGAVTLGVEYEYEEEYEDGWPCPEKSAPCALYFAEEGPEWNVFMRTYFSIPSPPSTRQG